MGVGDDVLRVRAKLLNPLLVPLSDRIVRGRLFPVSAREVVSHNTAGNADTHYRGSMWLITQWYAALFHRWRRHNLLIRPRYPPHKTSLRMSYFYFSSAASGAFSGLLAAGITKMDGLGGQQGWRWIFIMEGIVSVVIGVSCFLLLPDSPSLSGRWLKPDEQRFLNLVHQATRGSARDQLTEPGQKKRLVKWSTVKQVLTVSSSSNS